MRKRIDAVVGSVLTAMHLALGPLLHRWRTKWGATDDEAAASLPGDELVRSPTWKYTHAITSVAPRAAVWPWLVQIGQGRGGFYSYESLVDHSRRHPPADEGVMMPSFPVPRDGFET